ncbi:RNA-directed DNA polymerase, eukaryota [Tanacetum coccineum]
MPPRRTRNINDVYERIMARMDERLDQFVDQFSNRMNDMMNLRRCGDRNGRRSEDEELGNPFFEGDCSSSNELGDHGVAGDDYEGAPVFDDGYEEAPIFDDDQFEEESMPVYDTDIEDVIGEEEENMEDIVVVANDLCSSMIQTTLSVDFSKNINSNPHELIWSQKDDAERYRRTYEAYEQFQAMTNQQAEGSGSGIKRTRTYIPRDREEAEQRLLKDYFGNDDNPPKYPEENFRRRQRIDALGRNSIGPILKITSAIRQLEYGTTPDAFDEYLQIAKRCSRECLDNFTKCIYILYVEEYLRKPSLEDIEKTYALHEEKHGLPEMLGSIDCIHWDWKNCPMALHGQFKRKDYIHPTLMLKAVADQKL